MASNYDRVRTVRETSSEVRRLELAAEAIRVLKGLQSEVTYATVGMRMARFLPESPDTLRRYLRNLDSTEKLKLGLISEKQARDNAASALRGKVCPNWTKVTAPRG